MSILNQHLKENAELRKDLADLKKVFEEREPKQV